MTMRGLIISPVLFDAGAAVVPAAPVASLRAAPALSSAIAFDWRAVFGASAVREVQREWPRARLSSFLRSPARNAQVGGRPNSFHLVGLAADFVLPAGESPAFVAWLRRRWPQAVDVVDEGDHVHVEWTRVRVTPLATMIGVAAAVVLAVRLFSR